MKKISMWLKIHRCNSALNRLPRRWVMLWTMLLWTPSGTAQYAALVDIDTVVKQPFTQTIPITGRLLAKQAGAATTRIDGMVAAMQVQVGDHVVRGQVLAQLDTATLELQHAQAAAKLQTSNAQLALAEQAVTRLHGLTDSAAISQAAYDDAKQRRNIASAQVQEAQVALRLAKLELEYAEIKAPFNGMVTARLTEVGSYLQRGQSVVQLVSVQQLEAEADLPAHRLSALGVGDTVDMLLENGSLHTATVRAILAEEDPATRTRRVRLLPEFGQQTGLLASEQSVRVLIPISTKRDIVSVHKDAVVPRGADNIVFVVVDEMAIQRRVRLGQASGNRIEVVDGLQPGEAVVVRGNERLQPNQKVVISNPQPQ